MALFLLYIKPELSISVLLMMKEDHIKHLYWRAGFGITPAEIDKIKHKSRTEIVDDIFYDAKSFRPVEVDHSDFKKLYPADIMRRKGALMKIIADLRPKLIELNIAWFNRLTERQGVFREKMTCTSGFPKICGLFFAMLTNRSQPFAGML